MLDVTGEKFVIVHTTSEYIGISIDDSHSDMAYIPGVGVRSVGTSHFKRTFSTVGHLRIQIEEAND